MNDHENKNKKYEIRTYLDGDIVIVDDNGELIRRIKTLPTADEMIIEPEYLSRISNDFIIHDDTQTKWFLVSVVNNKIKNITFLTSIHVFDIKDIKNIDGNTEYYIVEYSHMKDDYEHILAVIPYDDYMSKNLEKHFRIRINSLKNYKIKIKHLLHLLIFREVEYPYIKRSIFIGKVQGWNKLFNGEFIFESKSKHKDVPQECLSDNIILRETPNPEFSSPILAKLLNNFFSDRNDIYLLILIRCMSNLQTFFRKKRINLDKAIVVRLSKTITDYTATAFLKNDNYQSLNNISLSYNLKSLTDSLKKTNDGIVLVNDLYSYDNYKKNEQGLDIIINHVKNAIGNDVSSRNVTVIMSNFAQTHIDKENVFCISLDNEKVKTPIVNIQKMMESLDYYLIEAIEKNPDDFFKIFNKSSKKYSKMWCSKEIPEYNSNIYIMLLTTLEVVNELLFPIFSQNLKEHINQLLCESGEFRESPDEIVLSELSSVLNKHIENGYFDLIIRKKELICDKHLPIAIIDNDYIYIKIDDTDKVIVDDMDTVDNINSLTNVLNENGLLCCNIQNSKCYRINIHSPEGDFERLYTYGISRKLISPDNALKLELIDKEEFLYSPIDFPTNYIIPLIKTIDGRIAGKNINCENKSNNHIFATGKSGRGKTYGISQLIPCFAMLGNRVVAFDVSGSFSKDEFLRALPQDVVDNLFTFICVGENECKVPINIFDIKDCSGLSAKKRFVFNVLRAASSILEKKNKREIKGLISQRLREENNNLSLNTDHIRKMFEKDMGIGANFLALISDSLDDIDMIGMADTGWDELFINSNKVIIISLGNECGDSVHQLLDMMVASLFNYQTLHSSIPLTIVIDEIKDQDFTIESPLETIITQGRKYLINLVGATQHYVSQGNASIDKMKDANIKMFFQPSRSIERIANELGFNNSNEAGLNSMNIGDCIISCDFFNKVEEVNESNVIKGRVVNFTETKLYEQFKREQAEITSKDKE